MPDDVIEHLILAFLSSWVELTPSFKFNFSTRGFLSPCENNIEKPVPLTYLGLYTKECLSL